MSVHILQGKTKAYENTNQSGSSGNTSSGHAQRSCKAKVNYNVFHYSLCVPTHRILFFFFDSIKNHTSNTFATNVELKI